MPSEGAQERVRPCRWFRRRAGWIQTKRASGKARERGDERNGARVLAGEERNGRADERQHGEERQDRKAGRDFVHGRLLQMRIAASATTASGQDAEVGLHAAALHARQQAAAGGEFFAAFVEAAVDDVGVEEAIELRPEAEEPGDRGDDAAPDAAVEPVGDARPPCIEGDDGDAVELVDVELVAKNGPDPGHGLLERIGLFGLGRFVAVEPPAEAEADEQR